MIKLMEAIWANAGGLLMKETDFIAGTILPHCAKWSLPTHTATPAPKRQGRRTEGQGGAMKGGKCGKNLGLSESESFFPGLSLGQHSPTLPYL